MTTFGIGNWLAVGVAIVSGLYVSFTYNALVGLKHAVSKAWANIDVLLKQRHDELPKLVETCKQYKEFEAATLEKVIAARAGVQSAREAQNIPALGKAEGALRVGLGQLFAVVEAYPELRANEHFMALSARITQLENAIADRREMYNEAVNINNVRVEQFPELIVARLFGFAAKPLLEFAATDTADVDVKALFR